LAGFGFGVVTGFVVRTTLARFGVEARGALGAAAGWAAAGAAALLG
jgi:hypothetical protein